MYQSHHNECDDNEQFSKHEMTISRQFTRVLSASFLPLPDRKVSALAQSSGKCDCNPFSWAAETEDNNTTTFKSQNYTQLIY